MARKKNPEEFTDDDAPATGEYGEEPSFDDPPDFVDDIKDEDLMPHIMAQKPRESDGVDSVIVVDGVPVVGSDRLDKLKNVIRKTFGKCGNLVNEHYPLDDQGKTKGYIFLEFSSPENAEKAVSVMNNYKLDKQHTFLVNLFSDFDKYESISEEWEEPKPQEYSDQGNLRQWLLEPDAADQFSVIHAGGEKVSIFTNNIPDAVEVQSRNNWTESYVKWSPLGTYLATCHGKGIALWGGAEFKSLQKLPHPGVEFIDFSPCEKYLVTFSPQKAYGPRDDPKAIIIWDTRTGVEKRTFMAEDTVSWPAFKWSHDDKFFARMTKDGTLSVFETPSFFLLDKKSIKVPGMRDFSWSPKENILAYWVAEDKDVPARVVLLEIPSRREIRVKNLFNVADCKMHWQKCGDYLCVKVDRYKKILQVEKDIKYAGLSYNFEIFHMLEKQIPVDSVEVKETVHAFSWEPVGSKFAIIHGDTQFLNVSFYGIKLGQTPILLKKYDRKTANHIFWSPNGQFVVLAGLRSMNGLLEFIDTSDFTTMGNDDHFMCTDVEWDPTGRYVITGVSMWRHKMDNAYWIWNFQGKILKRVNIDKFCQLLWRPRPPSLLAKEQIKDIKKNLKKYSDQFNAKDKMRQSKASKELMMKRSVLAREYSEYREEKEEQYALTLDRRLELRNGVDTDNLDESELDEEVVEFLVKEDVALVD